MLETVGPVLWAAFALLAVYCVQTLRRWRYLRLDQFAAFPQPGKPSLLWGHMRLLDDQFKRGDPRRHIDQALLEISRAQGNPPVLLLDLRPVSYPMLVIGNHQVAEQLTKPSPRWCSSTPKSPTLGDIWHLTGGQSILTDEGEHWKSQRRRLNPGFAPQHLLSTLPIILDKAEYFLGHLDRYASTGSQFSLDDLCTNLTFDIISAVTMGQDFKAQIPGQQSELLVAYMGLTALFKEPKGPSIPWLRAFKRRQLAYKVEGLIKEIVRIEYARVTSADDRDHKHESRSVLALSLQGIGELTPQLLQQTSDNLRVFMFAGHDTTSILMQWALYELSKSPQQRRTLFDELDKLFGTDADPKAIGAKLLAPGGAELLNHMTYTSAIIKETLRLHPPAATVRFTTPGTNFQLTLPGGQEICPDGCIMYINSFIIQRDHNVWGDNADDFVPERWLGDTSCIPAGAWRPFERGPRSCIGLELANIEAKVILALAARRYDFIKIGIGELDVDGKGRPVLDQKGYYKTKSELFNSIQVTAKPVDGSIMKVKLSDQAMKA